MRANNPNRQKANNPEKMSQTFSQIDSEQTIPVIRDQGQL